MNIFILSSVGIAPPNASSMNTLFVTLILTVSLIIKDVSLTLATCNRLYLKGLGYAPQSPWISYEGVYVQRESDMDGRGLSPSAVYKHEKYPHVLFLYESKSKQFLLTDNGIIIIAANTRGWHPQPLSSNPFNEMILQWMSYNVTMDSLQPIGQSAIRPTCVDEDFFQCDSGNFELSNALQVKSNGIEYNVSYFSQVQGLYNNLRPIYSAEVGQSVIYLHHMDNSWRIGHDYKSTEALALSYDITLRPEFITDTWRIFKSELRLINYNSPYQAVETMKLKCVGLRAGEVCNNAPCRNGGTCKVINGSSSFCFCPVGYYGRNCEKKKPLCRSSLSLLNGQYRQFNAYDGSITVWFCDEDFLPHRGFTLCQLDNWSVSMSCKIDASKASDIRNRSVTKFLNQHYWNIVVVLIVMSICQIFLPCQIFCCVKMFRTVCLATKTSQTERKEQIIAQFKQELATFEKRYSISNTSPADYSNEANAELADMQQRLEKAVDLLKTKRRKKKRKEAMAGCGRITSGYNSITILFWLAYLALSYNYNLASYAYAFYVFNVIAIIWVVVLAVFVIIESLVAADKKYVSNFSPLASTKSRIEEILATPPTITMVAECYHHQGKSRIVTATIKEPFVFQFWRNQSPSTLLDLNKKEVTKIKMQLDIEFGDDTTAKQFEESYAHFQLINRHVDKEVSFSTTREVPGFDGKMTTYIDSKPTWMNPECYMISTIFCVGWLYRAIFNYVTGRTEYKMKKLIFSTRPAFSHVLVYDVPEINKMAIKDYSQSTSKPSDEMPDSSLLPPPSYDTLYSVSNIKAILASLEKEGDDAGDDIPLTIVNSPDYVNVRLNAGDEVHMV